MTSPAVNTAKHSPPPAVQATPAAASPPPPPRLVRPLSASQIQLAEFAVRHHVVTLPVGSEFTDCLDPSFWSNAASKFRVCDKVDVFDARGTFYAEFLVRAVAESRPIQGTRGAARLHLLRFVELEPSEQRARPPEHEVKYMGPAARWCVVRSSDGTVVVNNLETRELAERHMAQMTTALA